MKSGKLYLCTLLLVVVTNTGVAQDVPFAPLPEQLATATKVFISNAGDQENADCSRAYNQLYAGIHALSRYEIVLSPAAASLIVELHYGVQIGRTDVTNGSGNTSSVRQFKLSLIDPQTHVILWTLIEYQHDAIRQSRRDKDLDAAIAALTEDFKNVTAPAPAPSLNKGEKL